MVEHPFEVTIDTLRRVEQDPLLVGDAENKEFDLEFGCIGRPDPRKSIYRSTISYKPDPDTRKSCLTSESPSGSNKF